MQRIKKRKLLLLATSLLAGLSAFSGMTVTPAKVQVNIEAGGKTELIFQHSEIVLPKVQGEEFAIIFVDEKEIEDISPAWSSTVETSPACVSCHGGYLLGENIPLHDGKFHVTVTQNANPGFGVYKVTLADGGYSVKVYSRPDDGSTNIWTERPDLGTNLGSIPIPFESVTGEVHITPPLKLNDATFQGAGYHALKADDGTHKDDGHDILIKHITYPIISVPICYTWESSPEILANFSISPALTKKIPAKIRIKGIQNGRLEELVYEKSVDLEGASISNELFSTANKLANLIDNTTYDLTWELSVDNGTSYIPIATTSNRLFVTAGTPTGSEVTITRINKVTGSTKEFHNEPDLVKYLWINTLNKTEFDLGSPNAPTPLWAILDDSPGQCLHIVKLFKENLLPMLGIPPPTDASIIYLFVGQNKAITEETDTSSDHLTKRGCTIGQNDHSIYSGKSHGSYLTQEAINFIAGGGSNHFEACYKYRPNNTTPYLYYAGGAPGSPFSSAYNCISGITNKSIWAYFNPGWNFRGECGSGPLRLPLEEIGPGPYPESSW